jgi:hypothetical protein
MIEFYHIFVRVAMEYLRNLHMTIPAQACIFLHMDVIHPFGKMIAIPSIPVRIHLIITKMHEPGKGIQDIRYNRSTLNLVIAYPYRLTQPQLKVGVV